MAALEKWDGFEDGVRRVILEQLDKMNRMSPDAPRIVHDLRLACKKVRAWLRLLRDALGKTAYMQENRTFRDLARRLSAQRDADVLQESVDSLREAFPGNAHADDISAARKALPRAQPEAESLRQVLADAAVVVAEARRRIAELPMERGGRAGPLRQAYRNACRREKTARTSARDMTPEALHEWRKQVKALHCQLKLVHDIWPRRVGRLDARLKILAGTLGQHHDLAVLEAQLLASQMPLPPQRLQSIRKLIHRRLEGVGRKALRRGRGLSGKSGSRFSKSLARRWKTWSG